MNKRMKEIEARKAEIRSMLEGTETVNLEELEAELKRLNDELEELKKRQEMADKINTDEAQEDEAHAIEKPKSMEVRTKMENNTTFDSIEYRKAFMQYVKTGQMQEEFRAAAMTTSNGAVIPTVIADKIVAKIEDYGNILPRVTRVSVQGGYSVPVSSLVGAAQWMTEATLASNGAAVDDVNTTPVVFANNPLVKAIGLSFVLQNTSIDAFETYVAEAVSKAMAKALETAIVTGDGSGKPTGILSATPAKNVTLTAACPTYKDLIKMVKAVPAGYRDNACIITNMATTYDLLGIVDTAGQPVGKVNYGIDGAPIMSILGFNIVTTDAISDLDTASSGDVVAAVLQLDRYVLNMAHDIDLVKYVDNATRNTVYQSFALCDGKVVDANGLIFVKKG